MRCQLSHLNASCLQLESLWKNVLFLPDEDRELVKPAGPPVALLGDSDHFLSFNVAHRLRAAGRTTVSVLAGTRSNTLQTSKHETHIIFSLIGSSKTQLSCYLISNCFNAGGKGCNERRTREAETSKKSGEICESLTLCLREGEETRAKVNTLLPFSVCWRCVGPSRLPHVVVRGSDLFPEPLSQNHGALQTLGLPLWTAPVYTDQINCTQTHTHTPIQKVIVDSYDVSSFIINLIEFWHISVHWCHFSWC